MLDSMLSRCFGCRGEVWVLKSSTLRNHCATTMCAIFQCVTDIGVELQEVQQGLSHGGIVIFVCRVSRGPRPTVFFVSDTMQHAMAKENFRRSWFYASDVWGWKESCGRIEVRRMAWWMPLT